MDLTLIATVDEANAIAKNGEIPWGEIREDLTRFKKLTMGKPVIMGRAKYESFDRELLPQGPHIVVSSKSSDRVVRVDTIDLALELAKEKARQLGVDEVFGIGGEGIYAALMPKATKLEITRVNQHFQGDRFLPDVLDNEWELTSRVDRGSYEFRSYARR